jgi:DtxR family Mn-dependent transcriptional regulator
MQDYLKAMLFLSESVHEIRVTDIAAKLNIAKATVAQEINHLKKHGLVTQERYGAIELTASGKEIAREVRWKHGQLKHFLIDVLDVNPKIAETDACLMEHVVSQHTMNRLMEYLETHANTGRTEGGRSGQERAVPSSQGTGDAAESGVKEIKFVRALNELKIGEKGRVLRLSSGKSLLNRLLEMGITPGTEIQVKGYAPMGDPIEVAVRGYRLTLRKNEASHIFMEMGEG